jgi:hypothetical protein
MRLDGSFVAGREYIIMTSAWTEPPDRDERAEGQDAGPDDNQLEMFRTVPRASIETVLPPEAGLVYGGARRDGVGRLHVEMMVSEVSALDFPEVGGAGSDELRRLEDSIRWLMNEGSARRMPRAATLPPVHGLSPIEPHDDDSLLLNPDTLFPPRSSRRRGGVARGAAKILLMGAVAAPAAYFIANWMQFPAMAPSDSATIRGFMSAAIPGSISVPAPGSLEERIAAAAPAPRLAPAAPIADDVSSAPPSEPVVVRGIPPAETSPDVAANASAAKPKGAPEQSPGFSVMPADPAPGPGDRVGVATSSPPPPVAARPKPVLSAKEITMLVERGRGHFDAGDLAAARLFFRRAANAGDAAAALAMGATYDPDVLAKRLILGIEADAGAARMWYEKARELGSPEGPRRLEMLAQRQGN